MTILFINSFIKKNTGNGIYLIELIEYLLKKSYKIKLISLKSEKINPKIKNYQIDEHNSDDKKIKKKIKDILKFYLFFIKNINLLKEKIIIFTSDPPLVGFILVIFKKIFNYNLIFWCQDIFPDTLVASGILKNENLIIKILKFVSKKIYNKCDKIITISHSMKENLTNNYSIDPGKVIIIKNWVTTQTRLVKFTDKKKFNIYYSGNLGKVHDIRNLQKFIKNLKNNNNIKFKIFSRGIKSYELKKKIDSSKIFINKFQESSSFEKNLLQSDFQIISQMPKSLQCVFPSKIYNILQYKKPILYFLNKDEDEISKYVKKNKIGIVINDQNLNKILNKFHNYKWIKMKLNFFNKNYEKIINLKDTKFLSLDNWEKVIKCVV